MFDRNRTGTISIGEFGDLFAYINQWKALFESIDRDRSGFIEFQELQQGAPLIWGYFSFSQICLTRTPRGRSI